MGRSKETLGKKDVRNKQEKKRKAKEKRRLEKKEKGKQSPDDMIAYVDEHGNITDTPPDPSEREEVDPESIEIGVPKKEQREDSRVREGVVSMFDDSKGYGFIVDSETKQSVFVHINDIEIDTLKAGNKVTFETEKGVKGLKAFNVKLSV